MNIKEMTFEEFTKGAKKDAGIKLDDTVKGFIKIVFDNFKNDIWTAEDLRTIKEMLQRRQQNG